VILGQFWPVEKTKIAPKSSNLVEQAEPEFLKKKSG